MSECKLFRSLLTAAVILFLTASCTGSQSPVTPGDNSPLSAGTIRGASEHVLWGIWDVYIDPDTSTAEVVPIRGASFECNVVNFLQPPSAPIHLLTIQIDQGGTSFPEGRVACDVAIKHPFPGTKFCGFDVMGIVMDDWDTVSLASDTDIRYSMPPHTVLQNPDGYTRWWNMPEFTTYGTLFGYIEGAKAFPGWDCTHTLNAFKYFSDDLDTFDAFNPDPARRGFFSSIDPGLNKRRYELQFPVDSGPVFHFKYAVSASWIAPNDGAQPPYSPDDFPITANMPEAYKISMIDVASTAYWQNESTYGGDLNLFIEVRDWQFSGDPSAVSDEISGVTLESEMFPLPIDLDLTSAIAVPGNPNAVHIPAFIPDVTPDAIENQLLIVTVKSANVTTYKPQIPGISGFEYPDGHLAAYNIFVVTVQPYPPGVIPPVADASLSNPTDGPSPLDVNLDPSASYDPDGTIVLYEWDYETDGSYDISSYLPDIFRHTFEAGSHDVTLRVTDDDGASDTDILSIHVDYIDSGWPSYRRFNGRTGATQVVGPSTNHVKFTYQIPDKREIHGGIVIDNLQRAVFAANSRLISCVTQDGNLAWSYDLGFSYGIALGTPAIDADNNTFIGTVDGLFYKFDTDGNIVWVKKHGGGAITGGCAIQDDGTIIYSSHNGKLYKIDSEGNLIWKYTATGAIFGGPSIGPDGTIYMAQYGSAIFALDQDGNEIWKTPLDSPFVLASPALGPYGIYVGGNSGYMYCLSYSGEILWSTYLGEIDNCAAIGDNGKLYVGITTCGLHCLDQVSGADEWFFMTYNGISTCAPVYDGAGHVYVGDWSGIFYCVDADTGEMIWMYDTSPNPGPGDIFCLSPAMADDGTILIGNNAGILTAFKDL